MNISAINIHVLSLTAEHWLWSCKIEVFLCLVLLILDGEKKAKKRSYEEIQPDDDFASQSSPAEPPQVLAW